MMRKEGTILRCQLEVYGERFHAELRKERTALGKIIYRIYKVYDYDNPECEEQAGCWSADNYDDAVTGFERYCGVRYTDNYKNFIKEYDKTRKI